jgi:hypothetical protein
MYQHFKFALLIKENATHFIKMIFVIFRGVGASTFKEGQEESQKG